jgi:hypothetical protein
LKSQTGTSTRGIVWEARRISVLKEVPARCMWGEVHRTWRGSGRRRVRVPGNSLTTACSMLSGGSAMEIEPSVRTPASWGRGTSVVQTATPLRSWAPVTLALLL